MIIVNLSLSKITGMSQTSHLRNILESSILREAYKIGNKLIFWKYLFA
jgi:hypothetical protein